MQKRPERTLVFSPELTICCQSAMHSKALWIDGVALGLGGEWNYLAMDSMTF